MRIGLIIGLNGRPGVDAPSWGGIREQVVTAEEVGFDLVVFEDGLLYEWGEEPHGLWESVSIAGAIAASTSRIEFGHSVINSPYRAPAMMAKIAATLDEISEGRYVFGLGAGNTNDYEAFGFPPDRRYSRFAEAVEIIHTMLKEGESTFSGEFYRTENARILLRGPRPSGPPIVIAAGGPKMLQLAARFGDGWNWWTGDPEGGHVALEELVQQLDSACLEAGRDPATLHRTLDVYSIEADDIDPAATAEMLIGYGELGFTEVRCNLKPLATPDAIESMAEVVETVQKV